MLPLVQLSHYQSRLLCEATGQFILLMTYILAEIHVGMSAIDGSKRKRNLAPMAEGWMLTVLIGTFGYLSGGHFNPAVSFAAVMVRALALEEAMGYWLAQVMGGFLGGFLGVLVNGNTQRLPTPVLARSDMESAVATFLKEMVFTFFLVTVALHTGYSVQRSTHFYAFAMGMTSLAALYAVGGVSGGTFNPAVATALLLIRFVAAGYVVPLMYVWLYWAAPMLGALLASLVFNVTHVAPAKLSQESLSSRDVVHNLYDQ